VKAEAAKLPGAGISPKPCPRKYAAEKGRAPHSVRGFFQFCTSDVCSVAV
jgi:hypothetical protein